MPMTSCLNHSHRHSIKCLLVEYHKPGVLASFTPSSNPATLMILTTTEASLSPLSLPSCLPWSLKHACLAGLRAIISELMDKLASARITALQIMSLLCNHSSPMRGSKRRNCTAALWTVDKKAFDSVPRQRLWQVMADLGISGDILSCLQSVYRCTR